MKGLSQSACALLHVFILILICAFVLSVPASAAQMMQGTGRSRTASPVVTTVSPSRAETAVTTPASTRHVRGGGVAATPISIPRPIKPSKASLNKIAKCDLISLDKNVMHIRMRYKVDASIVGKCSAGASLYDLNLRDLNARCKAVRIQKSPEGSVDVYLVLPAKPFKSATLGTFLIHSRKVVTKKYFKFPFVWDGQHGRIVAPSVIRNRGQTTAQTASRQKQTGLSRSQINHLAKINQRLEHGLLVGLDPGLGP